LQQIEGSMQRNDKQQGKSASSNSELQTLELPKKEKVETKSKPRAKMYCILCGADNSMLPRPHAHHSCTGTTGALRKKGVSKIR